MNSKTGIIFISKKATKLNEKTSRHNRRVIAIDTDTEKQENKSMQLQTRFRQSFIKLRTLYQFHLISLLCVSFM